MLFLLFLTLQTTHTDHEPLESLSPGNVLELGNFAIEVPEESLLVIGNDAEKMFPLFGMDLIPYCEGVFVSNANEWSFGIAVQYIPNEPSALIPKIEDEAFWHSIFSRRNLFTQQPVDPKTVSLVMPPTYNEDEGSFLIGLAYPHEEYGTVIEWKKVFTSNTGILILALRADGRTFDSFLPTIEKVFLSVTKLKEQPLNGQKPSTFLLALDIKQEDLIAFFDSQNMKQNPNQENAGAIKIGLVIGAILLLAMAFLFSTKKEAKS